MQSANDTAQAADPADFAVGKMKQVHVPVHRMDAPDSRRSAQRKDRAKAFRTQMQAHPLALVSSVAIPAHPYGVCKTGLAIRRPDSGSLSRSIDPWNMPRRTSQEYDQQDARVVIYLRRGPIDIPASLEPARAP
ncbi:hypothetical protein [Pseudorhodoferax sp.]|uniref:hypothetical protein n=1 Tax=Pseudorhodoferax sp. TaxID=1993553 RepID=UPI0039E280DE